MVVGQMPEAVDFVVVGAGPGGYTGALAAAAAGRQVVLVDTAGPDAAGGVCLLEGCIPSKALIRLANRAGDAADEQAMGLEYAGPRAVDMSRFQEWKNGILSVLGNGVRTALTGAGVTIVRGTAAFIDANTIRVQHADDASDIYQFDDLLIATGSTGSTVPSLDRSDSRVTDAAGVLALTEIPSRVVVIGAGYVGIELGTALAKLGASVTVVEVQDRILPGLDSRAADEVTKRLKSLGIDLHVGSRALRMTNSGVEVEAEGQQINLPTDLVVVAIGRQPNTGGLQLHHAGIETDGNGHIIVNDDMRCSEHIAAVGDVTSGPGLAHKAMAEARVAVGALCGQTGRADHLVPSVVFSDPEVASVGMSVDKARIAYPAAAETTLSLAQIGRSFVEQSSRGFASLVYDGDSRQMLGAVVCAAHATELIAELTLAIEGALAIDDLALTIHPHPTLSELIAETAISTRQLEGKPQTNV